MIPQLNGEIGIWLYELLVVRMCCWNGLLSDWRGFRRPQVQVGRKHQHERRNDAERKIGEHNRKHPPYGGGIAGVMRRCYPPNEGACNQPCKRREIAAESGDCERAPAIRANEIIRVRHDFSRWNHREAIRALASGHASPPKRSCKIHQARGREKPPRGRSSHQRKLDAMAHGVYALGAHVDTIAQAEDPGRSAGPAATVRLRDDGMVALAVGAPLPGDFLEAVDAHETFDENLEKLDKEPEFLHRNNQRVKFLAETAFHELRGLPVHQLALGSVGAALGFRAFRRDLIEFDAAIGPER